MHRTAVRILGDGGDLMKRCEKGTNQDRKREKIAKMFVECLVNLNEIQ